METTMNKYEQAEAAAMLARESKLDAIADHTRGEYRIGRNRYYDPISFTVAIITAFRKVGIHIPKEILNRPTGID
jgi:hypothetical protein